MGKPLKIILSIVAGVVLLTMLAIAAAFLFIQPNNFKPEIIAAVKEKTGRNLVIEGDLKLAVFPTLGLNTGKITLSNLAGFPQTYFASLDESHINVELLPLLSKKIEIRGVELKGLILNLIKNQQGVSNWDDLAAKQTPPPASTGTSSQQQMTSAATVGAAAVFSSFSVGAISIENAQVNWQDLQAGKNLLIKDLKMSTDKAVFNQPFDVAWNFVMVDAQADITQTVKLNTTLTVNEKFDTIALAKCNLQTVTTGANIPNKSMSSSLTIAEGLFSKPQQNFKLTGVELKSADVALTANVSGEHLEEHPAFQGSINLAPLNPGKVIKDFALPAPDELNKLNKLAIGFDFAATFEKVDLKNMVLTIDDTIIKGTASLDNFAYAVNFDLAVDTLDIDRYAPPAKNDKSATESVLALMAGVALLPTETLRKLDMDGNVTLENLKVSHLKLQDTSLHIAAKNGLVNSTQTVKQFYKGSYSGSIAVDARHAQTSLTVDEKMSHIQIEPLLQDLKGKAVMRGTVDASAQLQAKGNTPAQLQSSLMGNFSFNNKDGAIVGFSLQKLIDKGKSLIKGGDLSVDNAKNDETPFAELSGTADLHNNIITNRDLLANTKKVRVTGSGTANVNTEQLDYKLTVNWLNALETPPLVINVGGTFSKPSYKLDITAILEDKAKVENLINKVNTEENKEKIEHAIDKLKPEEKEKLQKLAPKVGKLFKKLF